MSLLITLGVYYSMKAPGISQIASRDHAYFSET